MNKMNDFQKEVVSRLDNCHLFQRGDFAIWKTWERFFSKKYNNVQFKIKGSTFIALVTEDKLLFYDLEDIKKKPSPNKASIIGWKHRDNYVEIDKNGKIIWPIFKTFEEVFDEVDAEIVEDIIFNMDAFIIRE